MEKVLVFNIDKMKKFKIPRDTVTWVSSLLQPNTLKGEEDIQIFLNECLDDAFFMDRKEAEHNEMFKQIIPYCILRKGEKIFLYKRSKSGGEDRLHDLWSFGVGGHINDGDLVSDNHSAFGMAIQREITEEVEFINPEAMKDAEYEITGLIYDRSNSVGKVHFGVIVEIEIPENVSVLSVSDEIAEWKWIDTEDLLSINDDKELEYGLENWSASIFLECLNSLIVRDAW